MLREKEVYLGTKNAFYYLRIRDLWFFIVFMFTYSEKSHVGETVFFSDNFNLNITYLLINTYLWIMISLLAKF